MVLKQKHLDEREMPLGRKWLTNQRISEGSWTEDIIDTELTYMVILKKTITYNFIYYLENEFKFWGAG